MTALSHDGLWMSMIGTSALARWRTTMTRLATVGKGQEQ